VDIEKLDLAHRIFLAVGPKVDKQIFRKLLIFITFLADRDTGDELKKLLQRL
jgi:hypothetical protein